MGIFNSTIEVNGCRSCRPVSHSGSHGSFRVENNGIPTYLVSNAGVQSYRNNNIQRSMVIPRNATITHYHNDIEQGVQTYGCVIMKNGQPAFTEEIRIYSA